jgi:phage repressor protein C with HTH and peptisase S24 domain
MEEWKQRLTEARLAKGLKKGQFASAVGVSNATITDWEKSVDAGGIKELTAVNLMKVCQVLEIDANWLLHGQTSTHNVEEALRLIPGAVRVRAVGADDPELTQIRKVRIKVQAGITGFQTEPEHFEGETQGVPTRWILQQGLRKEALLSIVVRGESMEPALYDGDTVVVNTADKSLVSGMVYVVNYEGEAVVKRMIRDAGQWWLASDNPDQRRYHRQLCKGVECIVIGKVIRKESTHI